MTLKAFEIWENVWDDDPVEGGRFLRERIGITISNTKEQARSALKLWGYRTAQVGSFDSWVDVEESAELIMGRKPRWDE